jgi:hypothetical protein
VEVAKPMQNVPTANTRALSKRIFKDFICNPPD